MAIVVVGVGEWVWMEGRNVTKQQIYTRKTRERDNKDRLRLSGSGDGNACGGWRYKTDCIRTD